MKRARRTGPVKRFVVIAERQGAELGRLHALALNEADALVDAPFDLAKTLGIDLFADDVRFRALLQPEDLSPSPQPPSPSPSPSPALANESAPSHLTQSKQDRPRNAQEIIESVRGRTPHRP